MKSLVFAFALIFVFSSNSTADFVVFNDRTEFDTFVGQSSLEDFNEFQVDTSFTFGPLLVNDLSLSTNSTVDPGLLFNIVDVPPLDFGGFDVDGSPIVRVGLNSAETFTIDFVSPINSFGADFSGLNNDELRTELIVNGQSIVPSITDGNELRFLGFYSDTSFTQVQFFTPGVFTEGFGLDNVSYSVSVPEPNSIGVVLGLSFLLFRRRSKVG